MSPAAGSRGYTLIEVLISVSVFAVLSGSVYLTLSAMADAAAIQRERSESLAALQLTVARLDADLRQLVSRPVRVADGGLEPALYGRASEIEGTRAGWGNVARQSRSQLQRFSWRRVGTGLQRQYFLVTDGSSQSSSQIETVLQGVEAFEIAYRGADGLWLDQWPAAAGIQALPTAVRYRLQQSDFGLIERIVVL
jgi:general secretion pathway protein J